MLDGCTTYLVSSKFLDFFSLIRPTIIVLLSLMFNLITFTFFKD